MITLYGSDNCSRCEMVKTILSNKGVVFKYTKITPEVVKKAREQGIMSLPVMEKDNKYYTDVREVLDNEN